MELDDTQIHDFRSWLKGEITSDTYLFQRMSGSHSMVYGTGSPQLLTLAMCAAVQAALNLHEIGLLVECPRDTFLKIIDIFKDSTFNESKTKFEQVSNFWLKPMQRFSQQRTKQLTGNTEGSGAVTATGRQLEKDRKKADRAVGQMFSEGERGAFYQRFKGSDLDLLDVIEGGEQYFGEHGSKARSKTTHGQDMKMSDKVFDAAIRRSCKFLIYDSIRNGKRIAYLLDDLDLTKVAYLVKSGAIPDDARIKGGPSDGKVPVCSTEIREIFRNWDYLERHVTFFKSFWQCQPPWAPEYGVEEEWAAYAAHRAAGLLKEGETMAFDRMHREFFQICIDEAKRNPAKAILAYHMGRPSLHGRAAALHVTTRAPETF